MSQLIVPNVNPDGTFYMELPRPPSCEYCGCTEDRACPGGCAWEPVFLHQGRYICTACVNELEQGIRDAATLVAADGRTVLIP